VQDLRDLIPILVRAISDSSILTFDYPGIDITRRTIEPIQIFVSHGEWYLLAFDLSRNDLRRFKIKRIIGEVHLDKPGSSRKHNEISISSNDITFDVDAGFTIDARLSESVANHFALPTNKEFIPETNSYLLKFTSIEEALKVIFLLGDSIEVISPPHFIAEIKKRIGASRNG
jgi:predicted DNA-binding transcriptional regulator YafY